MIQEKLKEIMAAMKKARTPYIAKVKSDRWGNRGKYIPAGEHKNLKPHNV